MLTSLFTISLGAILVNNFIFSQFLGICPFMGVSKKMDTALGMGFAVTFVMGVASAVTWAVNEFLLVPFDLVYMQTIAFILVIASLVQFIEMFLQKTIRSMASPAVSAFCWQSCCLPLSGHGSRAATAPRALTAIPSRCSLPACSPWPLWASRARRSFKEVRRQ